MWLKITFATTFLYALILLKNYTQGADATDNEDRTAAKEKSSDGKHNEQSVINIRNDKEFTEMMEQYCAKLVLVDYTASWCGPCRFFAPHFEKFASQYPDITFLKVDIDECKGTANSQCVQATPTFIFYRHMKQVKRQVGANKDTLVTTIRELLARKPEDSDLSPSLLVQSECECLNDAPDHKFMPFLEKADHHLESVSNDPKLIMSFVFTQPVSLYSLRINAPPANGPKTIKLYVNPPKAINFEDAANDEMKWTQAVQLKPVDLTGESVDLMCPHFHLVQRLQIFVESNQNSSEQTATRIDNLVFKGGLADASANTEESHQERRQHGKVGHFFSEMTKFMKSVSPSKSSANGESKN